MAATRMRVEYVDGTFKEVRITPRAQMMAESKFDGITERAALQATFYMTWASLNQAGKEPNDFETWVDKIIDCEDMDPKVMVNGVPVLASTLAPPQLDPTQPVPSPEPSSPSASEPGAL
jgi:hypothetical protein